MSTQQTEALPALIERFRGLHFDHAPDGWPAVRTREITALLDRITELESQLAQRFDAADMATASAQGFRDGVASVSAGGEPADTVVLNAAMRAIQQAIELIGPPTDERMRAVRRVLRGAVIVAEDDGKVAPLPGTAYAALPEYGINTASHAHFRVLGFTADQMRAFADATHTLRASHGQAPAGAGMGHTDGGRNMFYEGRFDGESQREQQARLRWANDMRAAFERHTGNGWFDKDWRTETGLWSSAWHACLAAQPSPTAQAEEAVALDHIAVIEDGELRYMAGRKAPAYDCELYAMPDGKRAPVLFTAPQTVAREPLTDEQIDQAIAELGLNYLADAHATNREVLRKLCHHAHGIKGGQHV